MAEYIEREALIQRLENSPLFTNFGEDGYFICNGVIDIIKRQPIMKPAADVVEVRRGRWAKKNVGFLKTRFCCSICGGWEHEYAYEHSGMNHCPNCGAKMDGKDEGE